MLWLKTVKFGINQLTAKVIFKHQTIRALVNFSNRSGIRLGMRDALLIANCVFLKVDEWNAAVRAHKSPPDDNNATE